MKTMTEFSADPAAIIAKKDSQMKLFLNQYFRLLAKPTLTEVETRRLDALEQLIMQRKETHRRRKLHDIHT